MRFRNLFWELVGPEPKATFNVLRIIFDNVVTNYALRTYH